MPSAVPTGLLRGVRPRCPNCGEGRLYRAYLKVAPECGHCGPPNGLYRAADAPPYFPILIVGHLVIAPMLAFSFILTWPLVWVLGVTLPGIFVLTLLLLPRVKGAVIGFHWATGPDGKRFAEARAQAAPAAGG